MGRKQKHNRLKIELGSVTTVFAMEYDGSIRQLVQGAPDVRMEYSGATLADLAEMFAVAAEQQQEDRVLSEQFREIERKSRLAEEPLPEQPEGLPEF